jgi:hypothetical protein
VQPVVVEGPRELGGVIDPQLLEVEARGAQRRGRGRP